MWNRVAVRGRAILRCAQNDNDLRRLMQFPLKPKEMRKETLSRKRRQDVRVVAVKPANDHGRSLTFHKVACRELHFPDDTLRQCL